MNTKVISLRRNGAAHSGEEVVLWQRSRNRWAVTLRGHVALLIGLVAFIALGALVLFFMVDVVADVIVAVLTGLMPTP